MKRAPSVVPLDVQSTGAAGLDQILGGGIPARSIIVVAGEPGSGKTVFTLQTLFHHAKQGRKCLYFTTLSEPAMKVLRYMQLFDFFDVELFDKNVIFTDLGAAIRQGGGAEKVMSEIESRVEKHQPAFVAIDSFRAIAELFRGHEDMRPFIYELAVQMAGWGATTFLVGEYSRAEYSTVAEFAIADGIIRLGSERERLTSVREMEVLKLRGAAYSSGQHFFDITRTGLAFYPRVSAPSATDAAANVADADAKADPDRRPHEISTEDRVTTGVEGLDELLGGGFPRASASLIQGGTGTGKTLLSLQFLLDGAARGERGVLFTLEESPEQLRGIARGLGWDLGALEAEGRLVIKYNSPVELSTDRFLHEARSQIRELRASRAVFDSLTTLALGIPSDRRFKEMVYALGKHLRGAGVSLVMTVESEQLLGSAQLSGHGASFIADNVVQIRYVEIGGRLDRAISVLKARGIKHDSELRSLVIQKGGLRVLKADQFKDMRGVLTGLPSHDPTINAARMHTHGAAEGRSGRE
jgi:circadian clock protein KaiC